MAKTAQDQARARRDKIRRLRELGVNPYPHSFHRTHTVERLIRERDELEGSGRTVFCAGRVVRYNRKGKVCFLHIKDRSGRIQVAVSCAEVGEGAFELAKLIDLGDWIGAQGRMITTKTGEYSLFAKDLTFLAKALRPLPIPKEKQRTDGNGELYNALKDEETRYRQRYLDLAFNDQVRRVFTRRSAIVGSIRDSLLDAGYLEVETPILQPVYGGARARPFQTHHHSAEFTLLEFYEAYADYYTMMDRAERLIRGACRAVHGSDVFAYQGTSIDVSLPWPRKTLKEIIREFTQIDVDGDPQGIDNALRDNALKANGIAAANEKDPGRKAIQLFEKLVAPKLMQPHIIMDFPKVSTPLCKAHREKPELIEQFEVYIGGLELANAYTEQNDPMEQRMLLERDAYPVDEDFLFALESGMPPTGGVGIGIDRLVMLLTDAPTIRDVLLFPLVKPDD